MMLLMGLTMMMMMMMMMAADNIAVAIITISAFFLTLHCAACHFLTIIIFRFAAGVATGVAVDNYH